MSIRTQNQKIEPMLSKCGHHKNSKKTRKAINSYSSEIARTYPTGSDMRRRASFNWSGH